MNKSLHIPTTFAALVAVALGGAAQAQTTWTVGPTIQQNFQDIGSAINSPVVLDGDTLIVEPGSYPPFDMNNLNLTITGMPGAMIDAGLAEIPCVTIDQGQTSQTLIEGLEFRRARDDDMTPALLKGGGAMIVNSSPVFRNCTFTLNHADVGGGAYVSGFDAQGNRTLFDDCVFESNLARDFGGAIAVEDAAVVLQNCEIRSNRAGTAGAGAGFGGGGSIIGQPFSYFSRILDCTFEENTPLPDSAIQGGGIALRSYPAVGIRRTILRQNEAADGAGIYVNHGGIDFDRGLVELNEAEFTGGGITIDGGINCRITNVTIADNLVTNDEFENSMGGGMYVANDVLETGGVASLSMDDCLIVENESSNTTPFNLAFGFGGAIYFSDASGNLRNCTFARNKAEDAGPGLLVNPLPGLPLVIDSSIIENNTLIPFATADQISWTVAGGNPSDLIVRHSHWDGEASFTGPVTKFMVQDCLTGFTNVSTQSPFEPYDNYGLMQSLSNCAINGADPLLLPDGTERTGSLPDMYPLDMGFHYESDETPAPPVATLTASRRVSDNTTSVTFTLDSRYDPQVMEANLGLTKPALSFIAGSTTPLVNGTPFGGVIVPLEFDVYTDLLLTPSLIPLFFPTGTIAPNNGMAQFGLDYSNIPAVNYTALFVLPNGQPDTFHACVTLAENLAGTNLSLFSPSNPAPVEFQ